MSAELSSPPEVKLVDTGEREAIIFIPGIGRAWDDPVIEGVARRMATAIDRISITEEAQTQVEVAELKYGAEYKSKIFTIVKKQGGTARPLIDVYGLDYNSTLVESYANRPLFVKMPLLAITTVDSFWRLLFRFFEQGKGWKEKLQFLYGLLIAALLLAYFVILIFAVVAALQQLWNNTTPAQPNASAPAPVTSTQQSQQGALLVQQSQLGGATFERLWSRTKNLSTGALTRIRNTANLQALIVLMAGLGFVLPTKARVKENISIAATNYLCLIHYLRWGESSHAIGGKLESLLEFIVERKPRYRRIHIVGYSFGSIVAMDNLFPMGREPIDRFKRIDTLVTIGCPFDIIRTYWPGYFNGRQSVSGDAMKWINVYSPIDVLSSNFANGGNDQPFEQARTEGIGVKVDGQILKPESIEFSERSHKSLGVIDILMLAGFKAHGHYWGQSPKGEISCFHHVVKSMYKGTPVLN